MYKPNLNLPLASSYNERGILGLTHTQTNSEDQRKINCLYEITKNSLTGAGSVKLTKRPGTTVYGTTYGDSSQSAYLICPLQNLTDAFAPVVFTRRGQDIRCETNTSVTLTSSSADTAFIPCFVDKVNIGNTDTIVLQARNSITANTGVQRVFFGSGNPPSWTQIIDGDFTGVIHRGKMEFMDGFAFILVNDNTNNQARIINSDLNSISSWSATGFINKQIEQDSAVGLAKYKNQILAFGSISCEAFYNAGNATGSPLLPIKQLQNKIGLVPTALAGGTHYYCVLEDRLYFIGRTGGGRASIGVYAYNGSTFEKVSTSFIDKILAENTNVAGGSSESSGFYSVNKLGFLGQNAVAISLAAPTSSNQKWLMYFPQWKDWFEWDSTTIQPVNNGEYFLGVGGNSHKLYSFLSSDNWQDNGISFTASTQFKLPQNGHQLTRMAEFGVLADTARASNQLLVEFSDNDDQSFYTVGNIELQRDIKTLNRGGSYRQRTVRLSSTNALETRLSAFIARIE